MREPRKSFEGKDFVLCETYSPDMTFKESYSRREVLMSLACINIVQAKSLISSLSRSFNDYILESYLDEIISYWGFEFHPDEVYQPSRFGGWISYTGRCVSYDLVHMKDSNYLLGFFEAGKINSLPKKFDKSKKKIHYVSPVQRILKIDEFPDEVGNSLFNIGNPYEISANFTRISHDPILASMQYEKLQMKRKKIFGIAWQHHESSNGQIERDCMEYYPLIDFIPNITDKGRKALLCSDTKLKLINEFAESSANPRLEYIKYYFPDKVRDNILGNPLPILLGNRGLNLSRTANERRTKDLLVSSRSKLDVVDINERAFRVCEDANNSWLFPETVLAVVASQGNAYYPVPGYIPQSKIKYLKLVKEFKIPPHELDYLAGIPYRFRKILRTRDPDFIDNYHLYADFLKQYFTRKVDKPVKIIENKNKEVKQEKPVNYHIEIGEKIDRRFIEASPNYSEFTNEFLFHLAITVSIPFLNPKWNLVRDIFINASIAETLGKLDAFKEFHSEEYSEYSSFLESKGLKNSFEVHEDFWASNSDEDDFIAFDDFG